MPKINPRPGLGQYSDPYRYMGGRDVSSSLNRVVDLFDNRSYYSGSDFRFEFDGIPVADIAGLSPNFAEQVKPHFGYASYTYHQVSRGQRMVTGQMLMNFRDPGQLIYLLQKIKKGHTPDNFGMDPRERQKVLNVLAGSTAPPDQVRAILGSSPTELSGRLKTAQGKPNREAMEAFRDALWGVKEENPYEVEDKESVYDAGPQGVTIRIIGGEPGYQQPGTSDQAGRQIGVVLVLKHVEFIGEGLEITETGEPTRVLYNFIAADYNRPTSVGER